MSDNKPFSVAYLASATWDALCMFFLPFAVGNSFSYLSRVGVWGQSLEHILDWPIPSYLACLIGACICIVSATIHLILLSTARKRFAKKYGIARDISALVVFVSEIVFFQGLGNSGSWFS